jgi:hypothetical protein
MTELKSKAAVGDWRAVKKLLAAGADPNLSDNQGFTALHHAVFHGRLQVVRIMLADSGPRSQRETLLSSGICSCLYLASQRGHLEVMNALVEAGGEALLNKTTLGCASGCWRPGRGWDLLRRGRVREPGRRPDAGAVSAPLRRPRALGRRCLRGPHGAGPPAAELWLAAAGASAGSAPQRSPRLRAGFALRRPRLRLMHTACTCTAAVYTYIQRAHARLQCTHTYSVHMHGCSVHIHTACTCTASPSAVLACGLCRPAGRPRVATPPSLCSSLDSDLTRTCGSRRSTGVRTYAAMCA